MNIILIFTYGISLKNWKESGLLSREIKLYDELNKKYQIKFTFLTFGGSEDKYILDNYKFIDVIPVKSIISFTNIRVINFLKSLLIPFKLKKNLQHIDLIKTNQLHGSWIGIILKILLKKPLMIRTGYDVLQFKIYQKKPNYIIFFYRFLTQLGLIFSDIFTVTSNTDMANIQKKFSRTKKIFIHQNYVTKETSNIFEKRHENKLISVGRLEEQKNYLELLKTIKNTNIEIDIVGSGSQKKELIKYAEDNSIVLNIFENVPNEELLNLYKKYKIFISSSKYEGNPKAILEAMASGTLVIALENKNISEILYDSENGILLKNLDHLPIVFNEYISNKEKFLKITNKASETISDTFSLESATNREYMIYKKIISTQN